MSSDYIKGLAPEELVYYDDMEDALIEQGYKGESYQAKRVYRDKLDVYQIGNIMYTLLTNKWIWEGHTQYAAMVAVVHVRIQSWNNRGVLCRARRNRLTLLLLLLLLVPSQNSFFSPFRENDHPCRKKMIVIGLTKIDLPIKH